MSDVISTTQGKRRRKFAGKAPRFRGATESQGRGGLSRSPYYWWWQYLKRNEAYLKCCELGGTGRMGKLYRDFGDVRPDDFKAWWRRTGEYLFSEPPVPTSIQVVDDLGALPMLDLRGCMVLVAPLTLDKRTLKKRFGELLRKHHTGRRGGNRFAVSFAAYRLATKPVVSALERTLRVYDLWKAHRSEWTLWQIGEAAKISADLHSRATDTTASLRDKRGRMAILVSRYVKNARGYIDNVGKGVFPKK